MSKKTGKDLKIGEFAKSTNKNKKYMVKVETGEGKTKIVHFGDILYEHYKDSTGLGLYSNMDHNDKQRRELYRARASKIKDKSGNFTYLDKTKANYYSYNYLW